MKSHLKLLFTVALCASFVPVQTIAEGFTSAEDTGIGIDWVFQRNCKSKEFGFEVKLAAEHDNPDVCTSARIINLRCDKLEDRFTQTQQSGVELFRMAFENNYPVRIFVKGCDKEGHANVKAIQVFRETNPL